MRTCVRAARSVSATVDALKTETLKRASFVVRTPAFLNTHEIVHIFLSKELRDNEGASIMRTWMWKCLECRSFSCRAERSFWRGVKLNYIMLKCVNAWQRFGRPSWRGWECWNGGGCSWGWRSPCKRPAQCFVLSRVPAAVYLSFVGGLFLISLATLTVMGFGFLHAKWRDHRLVSWRGWKKGCQFCC